MIRSVFILFRVVLLLLSLGYCAQAVLYIFLLEEYSSKRIDAFKKIIDYLRMPLNELSVYSTEWFKYFSSISAIVAFLSGFVGILTASVKSRMFAFCSGLLAVLSTVLHLIMGSFLHSSKPTREDLISLLSLRWDKFNDYEKKAFQQNHSCCGFQDTNDRPWIDGRYCLAVTGDVVRNGCFESMYRKEMSRFLGIDLFAFLIPFFFGVLIALLSAFLMNFYLHDAKLKMRQEAMLRACTWYTDDCASKETDALLQKESFGSFLTKDRCES